jgi:hypothetical protein
VRFGKKERFWALSFEEQTVHIRNLRGLSHIAELLRRPGVHVAAAELAAAGIQGEKPPLNAGIPMADKKTIKGLAGFLDNSKAELEGLQRSDWTRRAALQEDISKVEEYLRQVKDHHGQPRTVAGTPQSSRTAVTNAIRRAVADLSKQHPALARHLTESIKTGTTLIYAPVNVPDWQF